MGVFITVPYTLAAYIVRDFLGGDAAREEDVGRQTGLLAAAASFAQVCFCLVVVFLRGCACTARMIISGCVCARMIISAPHPTKK